MYDQLRYFYRLYYNTIFCFKEKEKNEIGIKHYIECQ